jgi:mannosyl-oligosaccharide glucosidase
MSTFLQVPEEFRTQYPAYGNPPTLPMGVTSFIRRLKARPTSEETPDNPFGSDDTLGSPTELLASLSSTSSPKALSEVLIASPHLAKSFLHMLYPKLKKHYYWFRETQRGQLREWGRKPSGSRTEAYRWRGRSTEHVLTSGLDDYPRAKPHEGELHLDLMSWMAFFTRTMEEIAEYIGETEDAKEYQKIEIAILTNLEGQCGRERRSQRQRADDIPRRTTLERRTTDVL